MPATIPRSYSAEPEAGPSSLGQPHESPQAQPSWDGLPSYNSEPTILPPDFTIPSRFERTSVFFQVLAAVYRPPAPMPTRRRWVPPQEHRDKCKAMVHFAPPLVDEDMSNEDNTSASQATPPDQLLYRPARSVGVNPRSLLPLRTGLMCAASIDTGFIAGKQIKYICRKWNTSREKEWIGFHSELALYTSEQYLKPLQGDVVPTIIGVHIMPEAISVTMELPHDSFWIESSPTMPDVLKERVIAAFEKIHTRGVLHGDPELRHMLIGADGRVTIIDFGMSRAITADDSVELEHAEPEEFLLEMRKVKFKLDYRGARKREADKVQAYLNRVRRNEMRRRKWERRKNGDKTGYISPYEPEPEDEVSEPPVHHQDFREDWMKAADDTPHRVVVPGQTEVDVASAVQNFIDVVGHMAHETPRDHDTLTSSLTSAFLRSKRRFDEAFELPSTWPFPAKRPRSESPEPHAGQRHGQSIDGDPGNNNSRRMKRVTFGGESHRHIDALTGRVVRCGERVKIIRQCSHPKCFRTRCRRALSRTPSSSSIQGPEVPAGPQHGSPSFTVISAIPPRSILKRKRVEDLEERQGGGQSDAEPSSTIRDTDDTVVLKKPRTSNPSLSTPHARRVGPRRRRRRPGSAINLVAPDPFAFVLPAWRIFSTFVTSLIPWRR
ncbi:hypothetical protein F5J12DRAFT_835519 [Pisolithus orientalis]|uniref:uncharacterized protein n=1 Tax=Pisolithus orientalis TaxID=936130 RepID=UPI00222535F2|nr:uncharacterized protein F5J12DRAFT_835519 [Pisolithus orientalis]KAI6005214.1 hypothetical protein F5J12DRAFT_835519 [Pisolithus orientalis]